MSTWTPGGSVRRPHQPYSSQEASKILVAAEKRLSMTTPNAGSVFKGKSGASSRPHSRAGRAFAGGATLPSDSHASVAGGGGSLHIPPLRFQWLVQNANGPQETVRGTTNSRPKTTGSGRKTAHSTRAPSIGSVENLSGRTKTGSAGAASARLPAGSIFRRGNKLTANGKPSKSKSYTPVLVKKRSTSTSRTPSRHSSKHTPRVNPYSVQIPRATTKKKYAASNTHSAVKPTRTFRSNTSRSASSSKRAKGHMAGHTHSKYGNAPDVSSSGDDLASSKIGAPTSYSARSGSPRKGTRAHSRMQSYGNTKHSENSQNAQNTPFFRTRSRSPSKLPHPFSSRANTPSASSIPKSTRGASTARFSIAGKRETLGVRPPSASLAFVAGPSTSRSRAVTPVSYRQPKSIHIASVRQSRTS